MRQTDFVILGLLSEAPLTGYQIKKLIDIRFRFFWNESYGQLYPSLKALSGKGFIEEVTDASEYPAFQDVVTAFENNPLIEGDNSNKGKRAQKAYRIKDKGLEALKDWLRQPVEKESVRLEILLKLYFSNLADSGDMIGHVKTFQENHAKDLKILDMFSKQLREIEKDDPNHPAVIRVIDLGQRLNRAYLEWSRETISFLEGRGEK
ncbi:MAG: PadR family transcriptional regulator [Clostridiales bacterium]|nr:PadR family transcriptional regulator [Clostridiales bacterium]